MSAFDTLLAYFPSFSNQVTEIHRSFRGGYELRHHTPKPTRERVDKDEFRAWLRAELKKTEK